MTFILGLGCGIGCAFLGVFILELRQHKLEVEAAAQGRMREEMAEGEDGNISD